MTLNVNSAHLPPIVLPPSNPLTPIDAAWIEVSKSPAAGGSLIADLKTHYIHPFNAAIHFHDVDLCEKILNICIPVGLSLSDVDPKSIVLDLAVHLNDAPIVKLLLDRGANFTHFPPSDSHPVLRAFLARNVEIMKAFIDKGFQIDCEIRPDTVLALCDSHFNRVESLKFAMQLGANINKTFSNGRTYFHFAILFSDKALCQFLKDQGVDINAEDAVGLNPLAYANKNSDFVPFLINLGVDNQCLTKYVSLLEYFKLAKYNTLAIDALKKADKGWSPFVDRMRLLGLRFGLKGIAFEGAFRINTYPEIARSLKAYVSQGKTAHSISTEIIDSIERAATITSDEAISRIDKGETVTLSCGSTKHEIVVVLNKEYLMIGNRGNGSKNKEGLSFYKINNTKNLQDVVRILLKNINPYADADKLPASQRSKFLDDQPEDAIRFINTQLPVMLDLDPVYQLNKKTQSAGNCSLLGGQMGFMGNLILSSLKQNPSEKIEEIVKNSKAIFKDWKHYGKIQDFEVLKLVDQFPNIKKYVNLDKLYDELFVLNFFNEQALDKLCALCPRLEKWRTNPDPQLITYAYQHKSTKMVKKLLELGGPLDMPSLLYSNDDKFNQVFYDPLYNLWIKSFKANPVQNSLFNDLILLQPKHLLSLLKDWKAKLDKTQEINLLRNQLNIPNTMNNTSLTPMNEVIVRSDDLSSIKDLLGFMLSMEANPSIPDVNGENSFHSAVRKVSKMEDIEVVKMLLHSEKDPLWMVNAACAHSQTPLEHVSLDKAYSAPLVKVLLDAGAEVKTYLLDYFTTRLTNEVMELFAGYYMSKGVASNTPDLKGHKPLGYFLTHNFKLGAKVLESWAEESKKTGNKDLLIQALEAEMPEDETLRII